MLCAGAQLLPLRITLIEGKHERNGAIARGSFPKMPQ
jgi:hypothetical protein